MTKNPQVIIIGAGPTGIMLAHLLAQRNISVVLVEKESEIFPVPRATHLDAETLRNFQMTRLMPELKEYTESIKAIDVVDENGKRVLEQSLTNQETKHFYRDECFFDQVYFEQILRKGLIRYPDVQLLLGAEATEMTISESEVKVVVKNIETTTEITGTWLIGCDGGRSFVREKVFSQMNEIKPPKDWILVDTILKKAADANLLPDRFRYYLKKERLTAYAHGFGLNRRWEFELHAGEEMPEEAEIKSWVKQFIDLDKITFLRIKKYTHLSLITPEWRKNRIFLAGDAAHLMPPFAGQGLCSGVRDAVNLAWKLADVIENKANIELLDCYQIERQALIKHTFNQTLFLNKILVADTNLQKWGRKKLLQSLDLSSKLKNFIQKIFGNPKPLAVGCIASKSKLSGQHLPQFLLTENQLSDDAIGYKWALIHTASVFAKKDISLPLKNLYLVPNSSVWEEWLKSKKIDFVLVRPDKIIFGAGKVQDWEKVWEEYQKWQTKL